MVSIDLKDIPELPVDMATMPWKPFTEEQKALRPPVFSTTSVC